MDIILASHSKYRAALLQEHGVEAKQYAPLIDEEGLKAEFSLEGHKLKDLALKLAEAKAESILKQYPQSTVIGSDQICVFDDEILNKPMTVDNNIAHLKRLQGKSHFLITCVCVINKNHKVLFADTTELVMRELSDAEIKDYVLLDQPMDCAGGYKYELNGYKLFADVISMDLTAIQGLPMIKTLSALKAVASPT